MLERNFGAVFTTIAAISVAVVWRFAPEIGPKLPAPMRDTILSAVRSACSDRKPVQAAATARPAPANAPARPAPASPGAKPAEDRPRAVPAEPAARTPAAVAKTAQNPTGSPYLEPAAKALREFRRQSEEFEKRQARMGMAEQREGMKKLNALRGRVEFYNQKHREWKESHPADPASGR